MLEVSHLTKKYGIHTVVNDLSFNVEKGQILGFLGPNGAGKSTTMNMITGCLSVTAGQVLVNGSSMIDDPLRAKRNIGYLPEIPPVHESLTSREYLRFVANARGIDRADRRRAIDRALEQTNLSDMQHRLIRHLSKGYRQRVGIAQAILGQPEVILLDEPMVGLDPLQIIEIRQLIRSLGKDHAILLSSHILPEVAEICDHVIIISHGRKLAEGTPDSLQEKLRSRTEVQISVLSDHADAAEAALKQLSVVSDIRRASPAEKETVFTVSCAAGGKEAVAFSLMEARCPILMLQEKQGDLEDIFLDLVENRGETGV